MEKNMKSKHGSYYRAENGMERTMSFLEMIYGYYRDPRINFG